MSKRHRPVVRAPLLRVAMGFAVAALLSGCIVVPPPYHHPHPYYYGY